MKPNIIRVYSENATFQHFETLRRNREKRHRHQEFVVEGVRQINLAVQMGWRINGWLYSPERKLSGWATEMIKRPLQWGDSSPTHYQLAEPLLNKLSSKEESSELLALVAMQPDDLARIPIQEKMLVVLFDRPASPGNLGTILRSCDAFAAQGLIITGHAVDLYDPETISASVGALFAFPIVRLSAPAQLTPWLDSLRQRLPSFQLIGSSAKAERHPSQCDWSHPTLLIVGNETTGMSAHYRSLCDQIVKIPILGVASSLNVACATSILLYEIDRQRKEL